MSEDTSERGGRSVGGGSEPKGREAQAELASEDEIDQSFTRRQTVAAALGVGLLGAGSGCTINIGTGNNPTPTPTRDNSGTATPGQTTTETSGTATPEETTTETSGTETPEETTTETPTEPEVDPSDASLVMHHPLDGDYNDVKNDVDGNPAERGMSFVDDSQRGAVLSLDGAGQGASGGHYTYDGEDLDPYVDTGSAVSLGLWVKPSGLSGWQIFAQSPGLIIDIRGGNLRSREWRNGRNIFMTKVEASAVLSPREWAYIVGTVTPGAQAHLYVNGEHVASASAPNNAGFPSEFRDLRAIGYVGNDVDGGSDSHYVGIVDDVRYYEGELSGDSVQDIYERKN